MVTRPSLPVRTVKTGTQESDMSPIIKGLKNCLKA
ncbi:hypothetical protein EVA_11032 [gut metagenome]|uniref:Uncharacterized protein n=1 Tax=gut metagenome TaxID=749906 RepID=J9G0U9_9ZZZZ